MVRPRHKCTCLSLGPSSAEAGWLLWTEGLRLWDRRVRLGEGAWAEGPLPRQHGGLRT